MPKAEFEAQVLREMRMVLRDNIEKIVERSDEELMRWELFEEFYLSLENFDYPHKDKLLEFIKYFCKMIFPHDFDMFMMEFSIIFIYV